MSDDTVAHQQGLAVPPGQDSQQQHHHDANGQLGGTCSYSQQTPGSQEASQPDGLTAQLHQVLVADTASFWTSTVAPSAGQIFQATVELQKEAADLGTRADSELQGLMSELSRVHALVAAFQDQIRETLSMLQG